MLGTVTLESDSRFTVMLQVRTAFKPIFRYVMACSMIFDEPHDILGVLNMTISEVTFKTVIYLT